MCSQSGATHEDCLPATGAFAVDACPTSVRRSCLAVAFPQTDPQKLAEDMVGAKARERTC